MIGRTLDSRYAIVRLLGQGGMGAVYEARHTGTGRRVAVKIILGAGAKEAHQVARFEREARAVGAVESEHIAQVFDTGRDEEAGAPYIAMEFLEGEDVQGLLDRLGPLPVDLALRIALQACLGLERAHAAGVIHRDIKPANLFLSRKEQGQRVIKLLDFGIAKVTVPLTDTPTDHALTKTGAMMGSPLYMSPEQARGSVAIDARSDLWSLGITLFQCLSGRRPHEDAQGLGDLIMSIISSPAPDVQSVAPWVPAAVAQVVRRALTIDLAGRYASAGELADALRALLPYGYAIVDPMLVPLGATTRAFVAPPLPAQTPQPASAQTAPGIPPQTPLPAPPRTPAPEASPSSSTAPPAPPAPPTTLGTTGQDPRVSAPRRPVALIAGGVAALVIGATGVIYSQARHAPRPVAAAAPPEAGPSAPVPVPPAAPPASAAVPTISPVGAPPSDSAQVAPPGSAAPSVKRPGLRPSGPPARSSSPAATPPAKAPSDDETSRK